MSDDICNCGTQQPYTNCCGPYHSGNENPTDPETLMRSRYSAFCRADNDYLKKTWHPETCPEDLSEEPNNWISLEIIEVGIDDADETGEVEFIAKLIYDGKLETLHELSQFEKVDGRWLYHSGEFKNDAGPQKISRNEPCPCASQKKFKNCHGK